AAAGASPSPFKWDDRRSSCRSSICMRLSSSFSRFSSASSGVDIRIPPRDRHQQHRFSSAIITLWRMNAGYSVRILHPEHRQHSGDQIEEYKRGGDDCKRSEQSFLVQFNGAWPDGETILHEAGEGGGEGLPSDNYVPAHHEDAHQHQKSADKSPPDSQSRSQEDDKGYEISEAVLENKNLEEVPFVNDSVQDIP